MRNSIKTALLFAILSLAFSCHDEEKDPAKVCGIVDPAENLPWMKEQIEGWKSSNLYTYFYIREGNYLGQTVFLIEDCCPLCDTITPVLDCHGNLLWYAPMEPEKTKLISDKKVVWKPEGFQCNL